MANMIRSKKHVPGMYVFKKSNVSEIVASYFQEWEKKRQRINRQIKKEPSKPVMPPSICFSRKIGVGALEVADILAEKLSCRVLDKEILTYIAQDAKICEKTVEVFDELYPGKTVEALSFLIGEKSFVKDDYAKHLFRAIVSLAFLEPAIFVGRGAYLILPRDRILAVRFIGGMQQRIKRLTKIFNITEQEAESKLDQIDKEQHFFSKRFLRKRMFSLMSLILSLILIILPTLNGRPRSSPQPF